MAPSRGPTAPRARTGLRAVLAGLCLLGAVGSCDVPKPQIPSIGSAPGAGLAAVIVLARGGETR